MISSVSSAQVSTVGLQSQLARSSAAGGEAQPEKAGATKRPPPPPPPPSNSSGADAKSMFEALLANDDTDGDGQLTKDEMSLAASSGALASPAGPPQGGRPDGPPPGGKSGPPPGGQAQGAEESQSNTATSLYESLFSVLTDAQNADTQANADASALSAKLAQQMGDAMELT